MSPAGLRTLRSHAFSLPGTKRPHSERAWNRPYNTYKVGQKSDFFGPPCMERKLQKTKVHGNESYQALSLPGTNANCVVVSFRGAKVHGNETSKQWRRQDFVTGVGSEVWVYRGSRVRSPPVPVVLSVNQRGCLLDGLAMYLSCDTKKFHDNESAHILHNFWTSTHRGEASPLPPPWRRHCV